MSSLDFLNVGSSFNIKDTLFNVSMVAFGITMDGLNNKSEMWFPRNGYEE